jgi:uncharacterized protein YndB with AHSA1/START domain
MEDATVERSIWIAAPRERVWQAITDPQQLGKWYATHYKWEIPALQVGAQVTFYNSDTDILHATIEVLDPLREWRLRWDPVEQGVVLVTTFWLEEENGGTRATITETGYEAVPADKRQEWLDSIASGYTMSMENLKAHVEGRPLPH